MDDRRFDSLAKSLATGRNRRSVLKGILGLGGAALAGSVVLDGDSEAARRPTNPTPTPVRCPGSQTPVGGQCQCLVPPAPGPNKCGPDCCNSSVPIGPGYSECCDQACCYYPNDCVGEELCCPRLPEIGCLNARGLCCTTLCEETPGEPVCCPVEDFCPGGSESVDRCCTGNTTCCGRNTNGNVCLDLTNPDVCCTEADCEDPCEICNLLTHTCGPRCNPETETCCTDQVGPGRCQPGSCCPGLPGCPPDQICCENARGVASCLAEGTFPHCLCQGGESCCCPSDSYSICCTGPEGECCGVDTVAGVTRQCDTNGHCCEVGTPYFCAGSGSGQDGCCATPCDFSDTCCVAPNEICAPGQNCCPVDEGWSCCLTGDRECCGGPDGRECDGNGHCCEPDTPYYCAGSGTGQEACCATPCCPDGTCGLCLCEVDADCEDDEQCCVETGLCVPDDAICCTPPLGFEVTPAQVLLCPECMTCNGEGFCVPNANADGSPCSGLPNDDDADDGICCDGTCVLDANCCTDAQCDEPGEICCPGVHICGPSCSGGVCCPGGFCGGPIGECCPPPNVGCNGGVCCDGECDGKGNCCPDGNFHCTGGVCCPVECAGQEGYCPVCRGDSCAVDQVCCADGCKSGSDYISCSSGGDTCCPVAEACCDVDGCCDGVCYGDGTGGPRDRCCPTGTGGLFCKDGALGDQCCADPTTEKCCGTAGCCAGQCTGDGNECCTTGLQCPLDDGTSECCLNRDDYKCCGTQGCCTSEQCNEEADVCCDDGSSACGTTDGNECCGNETEKCCEGVCIDRSECCAANGDVCPTCEPNCYCGDGVVDPETDGLDCNGGIAAGGGVCACGWCAVPLTGCPCGCAGDPACVRCADTADGTCETYNQGGGCGDSGGICEGEWCVQPPPCEPNCACSDADGNAINDGLACNGGGGAACGCGYCVFPIPGCPCGCEGDEECIRCSNPVDGVCELYNQLGICNGGAGFCSAQYCADCLGLTGACSVDTMCCSGLCDVGACVSCKQPGGSCDVPGDCCDGICPAGVCLAP